MINSLGRSVIKNNCGGLIKNFRQEAHRSPGEDLTDIEVSLTGLSLAKRYNYGEIVSR